MYETEYLLNEIALRLAEIATEIYSLTITVAISVASVALAILAKSKH